MKIQSLLVMSFLFIFSGCTSNWSGLEAVKVSNLGPSGYPEQVNKDGKVEPSLSNKNNGLNSQKSQEDTYIIQPGDTLSIKFFFNPELNEENLIVRPDGRISLQLIHEVTAANLTAPQLTALLAEKYMGQLKNPEIAVIVRSVREPYRIYVDGQVTSPGQFEIIGSLSVLQAIALAHGMRQDTAKEDEVVVIRRNQDGHPFVININLKDALTGKDLSQDIQLLPYDFVYVPRSFW
ncbi:MAG: polysaccharide biosynthesis/export family protein [Nitrospirales bacterium]|nr:polysaccharide export protein [Nitrospirales bacterium]